MIEVMQAYERGEQIECRVKDFMRDDEWITMTQKPDWNCTEFDYRIKPQSQYRPYITAEEFLVAQKEHGMYIRPKIMQMNTKCLHP